MSENEEQLRLRIAQLEQQAKIKGWQEMLAPDPSLASDEWWAVFPDYQSPSKNNALK